MNSAAVTFIDETSKEFKHLVKETIEESDYIKVEEYSLSSPRGLHLEEITKDEKMALLLDEVMTSGAVELTDEEVEKLDTVHKHLTD